MILESLHIQNFRSFKDETIYFDEYTSLVGPNGAGKSTVLTALNVFFRNNVSTSTNVQSLTKEDFHHGDTSLPVQITLTFKDLNSEAQKEFKHYYRQGKLTVSAKAEWNNNSQTAEVIQFGSRLVMDEFSHFFKDPKAKSTELKEIYKGIRDVFTDLPDAKTKADMTNALREYEEANLSDCKLVEDPNQFYGWSKGADILRKYLQWIYIPAVKDASSEQEEGSRNALGQLLDITIRKELSFDESIAELKQETEEKYKKILEEEKKSLSYIEKRLQTTLRKWSAPTASLGLRWEYDEEKSVVVNDPKAKIKIGEGPFLSEITRLGHGMQRSFIVSILQELAETGAEGDPTLLLGFEEPELYQHPPQAQHIASLLEKISNDETNNTQVIVTTHSPYFISSKMYENVRFVKKLGNNQFSSASQLSFAEYDKMLSDSLGKPPISQGARLSSIEQIMQPSQKELFFSRVALIVEGIEDVAFLTTWLQLTEKWDSFRQYGCHFVVANGKTNISRPLTIAKGLGIPAFTFFDGDGNLTKASDVKDNRRDNSCILKLSGVDFDDPIPDETIWANNLVMWNTNIASNVMDQFGKNVWESAESKARKNTGLTDGVRRKNNMLIAATLEELHKSHTECKCLDDLIDLVLKYAESSVSGICG